MVGSGQHDLDATDDAFDLLERTVDARLGRGLTTVVDTLGLDEVRRRRWLGAARAAGLTAVAVLLDTPDDVCRARNRARDVTGSAAARTSVALDPGDPRLSVLTEVDPDRIPDKRLELLFVWPTRPSTAASARG